MNGPYLGNLGQSEIGRFTEKTPETSICSRPRVLKDSCKAELLALGFYLA